MRTGYAVASAQHSQDFVFAVNEPLRTKPTCGQFVRRVSREQQQRQGLVVLSNNIYDGLTRLGPRYSLHVDFRLQ